MPTPTREQLITWSEKYVALWNAGDKAAWIRNWKSVAPGDFRMLDPVGTPEKRGFEECAAKPFDLFQPTVKFQIAKGSLFVCGNEVAWLMENHATVDGKHNVHVSIETYRFEPDGSVVIRTYYDPPSQGAPLGDLFETYLPGEAKKRSAAKR
ncbi:MAG TPA: hypothetical protein VNF72_07785 [Myxococcota bacterium]|jgi:hypothetical protein|nr:hypothetical protein [Myxococcota bacterium]